MKSVKSTESNMLVLPVEPSYSSISEIYERVQTIIDSGATELSIDCSHIANATSSHIGILWKIYDDCKSSGVKLILENATTGLVRVLYILDLGEIFGMGTQKPGLKSTAKKEIATGSNSHIHKELVPVSGEKLGESVNALLKFSKSCGVPEMIEFEMRTVFYEIMTNIIDHSGLNENDNVKFTATVDGTKMKMVFEDLGSAFDPTIYNGSADLAELVVAAKERRFKGFGLLMIRKLVDKIKYSRKEDLMNFLEIERIWS